MEDVPSRGEKRSSDSQDVDGAMCEMLDSLEGVVGNNVHEVLLFETESTNDISEIFSPPRIVVVAKRSGLTGGWSVDRLTEMSPGIKWDLTKPSHQNAVIDLINMTKPQLIIGSPPCSWFSRIMALNWGKIARPRRRAMLHEARTLLKFSCRVYRLQHASKRLFLHEHPASATSWSEDCIRDLLKVDGVHRRVLDMCRFGLTGSDSRESGLIKKSTAIITNSAIIADHLGRRCEGNHKHYQLKGGDRCARAAI